MKIAVTLHTEQTPTPVVEAAAIATDAELTELVLRQCDAGQVCWQTQAGWVSDKQELEPAQCNRGR